MVIGLLVGFGRYRTGAVRALLLGSAAGVLFALQAAVTKVFMTQLGHGVAALLGNWTTYTLIVSAIAGFVIQQSALRTDVLAPALASSNAVTLFASVVFGLTVFGETLSEGHGRLAPAIIGLILALAGIVLLAGAKPPRADHALSAMGHAPASRGLRVPRGTSTTGCHATRSSLRSASAAGSEGAVGARVPCAARRTVCEANVSSVSCRIHRMRWAAASGWSPNSWAIRLMQPRWPSCRTCG